MWNFALSRFRAFAVSDPDLDPLAEFRDHPQFTQIKQMVQQDPAALPKVVRRIGQSSPQLFEIIMDNYLAFEQMPDFTSAAIMVRKSALTSVKSQAYLS